MRTAHLKQQDHKILLICLLSMGVIEDNVATEYIYMHSIQSVFY